jgi:N utilization substance protein A
VAKGFRGPQITLSRSHPALVKKLFALEVPEIADGTVEIAAIAREAGHRTKIAVHSTVSGRERQGRPASGRWANVSSRMKSCTARRSTIVDWSRTRRSSSATRCRRKALRCRVVDAATGPPGDRAGLPAFAGHRPGGQRTPARRPADGWRIDIRPDNERGAAVAEQMPPRREADRIRGARYEG